MDIKFKRITAFLCSICFVISLMPVHLPIVMAAGSPDEGRYLSGMDISATNTSDYSTLYDTTFYNRISSEYESGYTSEDTALQIGTAGELAAFAKFANDGNNFGNKFVRLTNNIDLEGTKPTIEYKNVGSDQFTVTISGSISKAWVPIDNFAGTFDGRNFAILNMMVNNQDRAGLFGSVNGGTIKNVGIDGSSMVIAFSVFCHVGGIVGDSFYATFINCYNKGNIYASSTFSANACCGGIAGRTRNSSTFINCYNTGSGYAYLNTSFNYSCSAGGMVGECESSITIDNCYNTGNFYTYSNYYSICGGISGHPYSLVVSNCYNTGNVYAYSSGSSNASSMCGGIIGWLGGDSSKISSCYSIGNVYAFSSNESRCGGVVGFLGSATASNCYNTGDIYSSANSSNNCGGIIGFTNFSATVCNCYSIAQRISATGANIYKGGAVGINYDGSTIANCYYDKTLLPSTGAINDADDEGNNVKGLETSEMQGEAAKQNMVGFSDQVNDSGEKIWIFEEGKYPALNLLGVSKPSASLTLENAKSEYTYGEINCGEISNWQDFFGVTSNSDGVIKLQCKSSLGEYKDFPTSGYLDAGAYTLKVTQEASDAYNAAEVEKNFAVVPKIITILGLQTEDKEYDGTNVAKVTKTDAYKEDGKVDDDVVVAGFEADGTTSGTFESKNVKIENGEIKEQKVTVAGLKLQGEKALNYILVLPDDLSAKITQKEITFTVDIADKNYDGTTVATIVNEPILNGLAPGDEGEVRLSKGHVEFQDPDVGLNKAINFIGYVLDGPLNQNYKLALPNKTASISRGFVAKNGEHYTISDNDGEDNWYKNNNFRIEASEGYKVSENDTDAGPWLKEIEKSEEGSENNVKFYVRREGEKFGEIYQNEISQEASEAYKKDSEAPTAVISIRDNQWRGFLNWTTFGYFFKDSIDVNIDANDSISGIKSIEYQLIDNKFESISGSEEEKKAIIINELNKEPNRWITYDSPIKITQEEKQKFSIYAKITDKAGNVSVINTHGIVLYKDSTQDTESIEFTKTSEKDVSASVNLNGNTISKIMNGNYTLSDGKNDQINTDYEVTDGTILLKSTYLNSLEAKEEPYTLTIYYNPAGENYDPSNNTSEEPNTTVISLKVLKSNQDALIFNEIADVYVYGDDKILLQTTGGSGTGEIIYSLISEDNCASILGNEVTILGPGKFKVMATKAGDDNYNEIIAEKEIVINKKIVTITGMGTSNKVYDSTTAATINWDDAQILGKIGEDKIEIDREKAIANFENKNAGSNKVVNFDKLELIGNDADKYSLSLEPLKARASISQLGATIVGVTAENKMYDGSITAQISGVTKVKTDRNDDNTDVYAGDMVNIKSGKAEFLDKDVGENIEVTFSEFELEGDDAVNYILKEQPAKSRANITKKNINIDNLNIKNKNYDGTTEASFEKDPALNGVIENDDVKLAKGVPYFESAEPGENIVIYFDPQFSIFGEDASNYELQQPEGITGNILNGFVAERGVHYTVSEKDGLVEAGGSANGWYRSEDFKIIAADGYQVSEKNTKDSENWKNELIYNDETTSGESKEITFYVRRIDSAVENGNIGQNEISVAKQEFYKKDQTPPTGSINIGENKWTKLLNIITFGNFFKDTQKIIIESDDENSGIYSVNYYKSENKLSEQEIINLPDSEWINNTSFQSEPDSKFVVYAKITDNAGNITYISTDGIVINATAPSISISSSISENTWTNDSNAKLDVIVTHALPVIDKISYQIGENDPVNIETTDSSNFINSASDKVEFTIENIPDGEYDIKINAAAKLEIHADKKFAVKKDTKNPIITDVSINPADFTKDNVIVEVNIDASSELSGLASEAYSFDGGKTWQSSSSKVYEFNTIIPLNTIKIRDNANNIVSYENEIVIDTIDKLKPKIPIIEGIPLSWSNKDITLKVVSRDEDKTSEYAQSDLAYFEYSIDGGATFTKVDWSENPTFTIAESGDYTNKIFVRVADKAGNISDLSEPYTVKIDKNLPEILSVEGNAEDWTNQDVTLTINAQDSDSGLNTNSYSFDGGETWQSSASKIYKYNTKILSNSIKIRDDAGNVMSYENETEISKIDKLKPNTPSIIGASNEWRDEDVILKVASKDNNVTSEYAQSGLAYFEYSIDGGATFTKVDWSENPTFTIAESGDYTNKIFVRVVDKAGNISDLSEPYTAKIDKNKLDDGHQTPSENNPNSNEKPSNESNQNGFEQQPSQNGDEKSTPSDESKTYEFKQLDQNTGVIVKAPSGVVPKNSKVIIEQLEQSNQEKVEQYENAYGSIDAKTKETMERCKLFEIHIVDSEQKIIQPNGLVEISIPIPENFDKTAEDLDVYRIQMGLADDDDFEEHIEEIDGIYYCTFKTDHFSPYALVDKNTNINKKKSVNITIVFVIVLLAIIGAILFMLYIIRKTQNKDN